MDQEKIETIKLNYEIPNSTDAEKFGPATWCALHDIVENIPCPICRVEAVSFMRFFHDMKNVALGKPVMYKQNYLNWLNKISKIKNKPIIMK